jgi:hypothetical protein
MKIQDIIDAMKKNGLPHHQGSYIKYDPDEKEVVAACIWGQAGKNTGFSPADLQSVVHAATGIDNRIVVMNDFATPKLLGSYMDYQPIEYEKVVAYAEEVLTPYANVELDMEFAETWEDFVRNMKN